MLSKKFTAVAGETAAEATDDYFKNTTLLLSGDGTNGAQNNTFTDSSTNNFTITRNGNTTQGSYSPYGSLWSNYFNGASTLAAPANAAFTFGTGDFTVEGWLFSATANSTANGIFQQGTSFPQNNTTNTVAFGTVNSGQTWQIYVKNTSTASTATWSLNTWYHFALVRNSGTTVLYINGTAVITVTSDTTNYTGTYFGVGQIYSGIGYHEGYISNVRVVKGTAVYTSAFTPPTTPLTAISGTSFLTCQSNRFIDNSTNAFAITVGGTPSVQRFSPFNPTAAYSTATIGGSGYFDGTGDYLSVASNAAFALGTGDFIMEFWLYPTSSSQRNITMPTVGAPIMYSNASNQLQFENYGAPPSINTTITLKQNAWNHCVASRVSGTTKLFINGVEGASSTAFSSTNFVQSSVNIGTDAGTYYCNGYMSDVRIVKGSGVTSVTVPTAPLTAVSGTSLLLSCTNAGIYDNAMMNDLETVGGAQISTSVKKYGTGSIALDGTGDGLLFKGSPSLAMGTGDFTVEFWLYSNANQANFTKYFCSGSSVNSLIIDQQSTANTITVNNNSSVYLTSSAFSNSTWNHIAVVRYNGTITIYINGTSAGSVSNSTNFISSDALASVGCYTTAGQSVNGYIDDFRITKGLARYTTTFTPPTAALPTY